MFSIPTQAQNDLGSMTS